MKYFDFATGLKMTSKAFDDLFGGPPRQPEGRLTQKEMDIANSIQYITEEIMLRLARSIHKELGVEYFCLAGGVALNCVANGRILREGPFKDIWIQPAAGDAGGALGAALVVWHEYYSGIRSLQPHRQDSMKGAYLGPAFSNEEIEKCLNYVNAQYVHIESEERLCRLVAEFLTHGSVVGWFHGRMEFGPRALGNRSILGDARNVQMQKIMNLKIKFRESFRPFAPVVLAEDVGQYFDLDRPSPYMLLVSKIKKTLKKTMTDDENKLFGIEKLNRVRSTLPAITHIDYSARVQTVHKETNPRFHHLLSFFKEITGYSVLVNTSFNVRGEPIVCTPEDAYRCFMRTEIDYLVLGDYLLKKSEQPSFEENDFWKEEFVLD